MAGGTYTEEPEPAPAQRKGGYMQINKALNICAFEDYLEAQLSRLPDLADVEQLSPRVIRVLGQNAGKFTLQGTNTYIIGTGRERLILDTAQGIPKWAELISHELVDRQIKLSSVLLTHWHGDHMGGVPDLLRLYPHLSESIYKHTPGNTQKPIVDGQTFSVEGATIRAVHAPGHSHDHMCFVLEEENAMFTGDMVLGSGTAAVEQLNIWMGSMRAIKSHDCAIGYPAHGQVIPDLPKKIAGELATKLRRERQVLKALQSLKRKDAGRGKGSVTLHELVTEAYGNDLDKEVRQAAIEPFTEEVLRKLTEDGQVAFEVRGGQKKWFGIGKVQRNGPLERSTTAPMQL